MILQNVGRRVDDFARAVSDLIADEDVIQEKLNAQGKTAAKEHVQDSYLILHHGYEWGANAEYRMDDFVVHQPKGPHASLGGAYYLKRG